VRLHQWHERAALRSAAAAQAQERLQREQPGVLFCTHQRAILPVPIMAAARRLGIPTSTFIYSWDNPPKGRMAVHADHVLVWSDWMREEMARYYPDTPSTRVHVVGTPQFEHYFNSRIVETRGQFCAKLALDPRRSIVCFSGDDRFTSPHDPAYLADIARASRQMEPGARPQLVFRRCPTDLSGRYESVLREFGEIVVSEPLWRGAVADDWMAVLPMPEDVALLANLARHADLMINLGSTMAMDAAVFGKPSIFVAYDPDGASHGAAEKNYQLPHFEWVHKLQPVYWARAAGELAPLIRHALAHPAEKEAARRAWLEKIVAQPMDCASSRCVEVLEQIASSGSPSGSAH
jgi:hypothetical protein